MLGGQSTYVKQSPEKLPLHLLELISKQRLVSVQVIQGSITTEITESYIDQSIKIYRHEEGIPKMNLHVLFNNASVHRTKKVIDLALMNNVFLQFKLSKTSEFSPIELFFGTLKQACKHKVEMRR